MSVLRRTHYERELLYYVSNISCHVAQANEQLVKILTLRHFLLRLLLRLSFLLVILNLCCHRLVDCGAKMNPLLQSAAVNICYVNIKLIPAVFSFLKRLQQKKKNKNKGIRYMKNKISSSKLQTSE